MRVVIPWRDRVGYLSICLATLKEAMRNHNDVHVTIYNNESVYPLPEIAKEFEVLTLAGGDCHHVFIDMFNREFDRCSDDFIVNMDSDCCVHPSFITAAKLMVHELPNLGHASLYSEGNHPEPKEKTACGKYHIRPHISMTASIVSRIAWKAFEKPKRGQEIRFGCIDGAFSTFVHERFKACYSTVRSYVEHIGAIGAYSHLDEGGATSCHRARRFDWRP